MKCTNKLKNQIVGLGILSLGLFLSPLWSQSISEKKANLQSSETGMDPETEAFLIQINQETREIHSNVDRL